MYLVQAPPARPPRHLSIFPRQKIAHLYENKTKRVKMSRQ